MKYAFILFPFVASKLFSENFLRQRRVTSPINQFFLDDDETDQQKPSTDVKLNDEIPTRIEDPKQFLKYMKLFEFV